MDNMHLFHCPLGVSVVSNMENVVNVSHASSLYSHGSDVEVVAGVPLVTLMVVGNAVVF